MASFTARLLHAPFPYDGRVGDEATPFFDTTHRGQRAHSMRDGKRYAERPHYSDDRVLFHMPRGFDVTQPFELVVFFHGHNAELRRTVLGELRIAHQLDLSGRNALLIAPALARDAACSAPGKLYRRNGLKRLLDEAATVLAQRLGKNTLPALRKAPVILAAFSGGYRTVAYSLDRGGIARRIRGVVLLDALYGEQQRFAAWIKKRAGFAVVLGGPSTQRGQRVLERLLRQADVPFASALPDVFARGTVVMKMTTTSHRDVPLIGPPRWPLAAILKAPNGKNYPANRKN